MSSLVTHLNIKVALLGAKGVGKTSIVGRFVNPKFDGERGASCAPNCLQKTLMCDTTPVSLSIWDVPGHDKFLDMGSLFISNADIVYLVFDLSDISTLAPLERWLSEVREKSRTTPLITLVGNKSDLPCSPDSHSQGSQFAQSHQLRYEELSSKDYNAVKSLFTTAAVTFSRGSGLANASMMLSKTRLPSRKKGCC